MKSVISVDSGPLVDKAIAQRAGIGWYGKNTLIYSKDSGSRIFLGEILCDLELEADESQKSKCSECNICLRACPTGALRVDKPYKINPLRCISYLTQKSGFIPLDKRGLIGNRIFGCDICQDVCPFNKTRVIKDKDEFKPLIDNPVKLEGILRMGNREFEKRFGHTALYWRGKNIIQRNAVIALGNLGREDSVDILIGILEHPSPIVRGHVPWALSKIGVDSLDKVLSKTLKREKDERVIKEIKLVLDK